MLDVLAGYDPNDQGSAKTPKVDYGAAGTSPDQGHAHCAGAQLVRRQGPVTPEMKAGIDEAVRVLKDLGATVEDVVFPDIWDYHICGRVVITAEAHAIHRQEVIETPEKFGYTTRRRFQLGAFLTAEQYLSALRFRRQLQSDTRAAMRGYDLVMAANQWGPPETFEEPQPIFHFLGKPCSACRSTSPASRRRRCAAASAATAFRLPSSSPAAPSTKPASSPRAPPTNAPRRGARTDPSSDLRRPS